jgi:hypothetical protein
MATGVYSRNNQKTTETTSSRCAPISESCFGVGVRITVTFCFLFFSHSKAPEEC